MSESVNVIVISPKASKDRMPVGLNLKQHRTDSPRTLFFDIAKNNVKRKQAFLKAIKRRSVAYEKNL